MGKLIDTNGLQRFWTNICKTVNFAGLTGTGAAAHNCLYRGKCLGTSVTDTQYAEIAAGTFRNLYVGDYWTINGQDWVICDFDYYIRCGSEEITDHHLILVPRTGMTIPSGTALYGTTGTLSFLTGESSTAFKWNSTNSTNGGYKYSRMRKTVMKAANTIVINAFGSNHVKAITELYPNPSNATASGIASSWAWFNNDSQSADDAKSICDLCNETMVYEQQIWSRGSEYTKMGYEIGFDKFQLSIFALDSGFANIRADWWLRSVTSDAHAAYVNRNGHADDYNASGACAVRPRFVLVG